MKNQKNLQQNGYPHTVNLISEGTEIQGEIHCNGDIRVDGKHSGVMRSEAKVVIGSTGIVEGDVYCESADVHGCIEGTITAKDILYLKGSARIEGDVSSNKLVVESGAVWNGKCNMGRDSQAKEIPSVNGRPKAEQRQEEPATAQ